MTEKEKRDLGMIYNPNYDQELGREIIGCKDKCFAYNQLMPTALEKRQNCCGKSSAKPEKTL